MAYQRSRIVGGPPACAQPRLWRCGTAPGPSPSRAAGVSIVAFIRHRPSRSHVQPLAHCIHCIGGTPFDALARILRHLLQAWVRQQGRGRCAGVAAGFVLRGVNLFVRLVAEGAASPEDPADQRVEQLAVDVAAERGGPAVHANHIGVGA